jgi:hypothetical protein
MKSRLIYNCRNCGERQYGGDVREYNRWSNGEARYVDAGMSARAAEHIWHDCYQKDGIITPVKYMGICDLVGLQEVPEPKEDEHGEKLL